jgi:hypothetical protein
MCSLANHPHLAGPPVSPSCWLPALLGCLRRRSWQRALRVRACGLSAASILLLLTHDLRRERLMIQGPLPSSTSPPAPSRMPGAPQSLAASGSSSMHGPGARPAAPTPSKRDSCIDRRRARPAFPWDPPAHRPPACAPHEPTLACCLTGGKRCRSAKGRVFGTIFRDPILRPKRPARQPFLSRWSWP